MIEYFVIAVFAVISSSLYLYKTFLSSVESGVEDNSIDAFIIKDDGTVSSIKKNETNKYKRDYTTEGRQILILYGTEYGCSEEIARILYDRIQELNVHDGSHLLQPRLINMKHYKIVDFDKEQVCFVIVSTSGDGVPPSDAKPCYDYLHDNDLDLSHLKIALLALGDSNYPQFCMTGRTLYKRLVKLGCSTVVSQVDVDMEDWSAINTWLDDTLHWLQQAELQVALDYIQHENISEDKYSRNRPFLATLKTKYLLTVCDSADDKETIHCEFDLTGSDLNWTSGDALGIYPENNPEDVQWLLQAMKCDGQQSCETPNVAWFCETDNQQSQGYMTLSMVLQKFYDLKHVKRELLELLYKNVQSEEEQQKLGLLLKPETNNSKESATQIYLQDKEVGDVLLDYPTHTLHYTDILRCMKYLQPRYYSISSSPLVDSSTACVTAAVVRYTMSGRQRGGVTTTYLQDRLRVGQKCPVFISQNLDFRLPDDETVPLILIGPGTGIAPFIAFIQERTHTNSGGEVHLYFGCRHRRKDFLYRSYLEDLASNSKIKLSVAFSRDQPEKVYVQDLLHRDRHVIWRLLEQENASLYVCGDAKSMAGDVDKALLNIVQEFSPETDAKSYITSLEKEHRYQKDVWVV